MSLRAIDDGLYEIYIFLCTLEKEEDAKTTFSFNLSTFDLMQYIVKVYGHLLHYM